jgi:hypothetical protein
MTRHFTDGAHLTLRRLAAEVIPQGQAFLLLFGHERH